MLGLSLAGCAGTPGRWSDDSAGTLREARAVGRDAVIFFRLAGREQSDRMQRVVLLAPEVTVALDAGGFASLSMDGFAQQRLYSQWIGGGEGMGVCVLDSEGRVYAARPGPQDPPELAAFLRLCASRRQQVLQLRAALARAPVDGKANLALGCALLDLGCRVGTEDLLVRAAQAGEVDANHRLARLFALDGRCERARQWLRAALPSAAADVTLGYVLFKERKHVEAATLLAGPARDPALGDEALRARLYLGKALHECGRDAEARVVLQSLAQDASDSIFGASALHSLTHLDDKDHGHTH